MKKNYLSNRALASVAALMLGSTAPNLWAQAVIFPQQTQAGTASLTASGGEYVLSNNLLTASFRSAGGKLLFDGCPEMDLKAGTELFKVVLGDGTSFSSSDMTLESVETEDLTGDAKAVKGSDRFNGKAIKAVLTKDGLKVTWHAVLRDGSHYLRTEMDIAATGSDIAMQSITPMLYTVDNSTAKSVPSVVGNTRGAVLISDKIFAGLETPMGINSSKAENAGMESFTPKSWTPESFVWSPGSDTPAEILKIDIDGKGTATSEQIVAARGYVTFKKAGEQTITFEYKSGNHRLNLVGVDVVDGQGNVKASDYHYGYTGGLKSNNVYTLNIPETGAYVLRYFVETKSETVTSSGNITFSEKIGVPVVVYDLVAGTTQERTVQPSSQNSAQLLDASATSTSPIYDRNDWTATVDGYTEENGCGKPENIIDGDASTYWHSHYSTSTNKNMPHWFMVDMKKSQEVAYLGFTTRQATVDVNGHIKEYEVWTGDDANNLTKQMSGTMSYTLDEQWIALPSPVTCRYIKVVINSSQNGAVFAAVAEFRAASSDPYGDQEITTLESDETVYRTWNSSSWTQTPQDEIPYRVTELDHNYPNIYQKLIPVRFEAGKGTLVTDFTYQSGNNRLNMVGVDLIDANGNVAVGEYHFGYTGDQKSNASYSLFIPAKGDYKLRLLVSKKTDELTSTGKIGMTYTVVDTLHMVAPTEVPIEGYWYRPATLSSDKDWNVSSVVGLVAEGQQRRSFLAYSERERAVPWRAMPVYISWYELNIDRNNAVGNSGNYDASDPNNTKGNYSANMNINQCVDVLNQWKTKFYDVYGKTPVAYVWDDGWDAYGTWTFNSNFPDGFTPVDNLAKQMGSGIGAWLGPVGGYGASGNYRRKYWNNRGGMQLSNKTYYNYFIDCCKDMIKKYDFRFFKFDGISAQASAVGPDLTDAGIENCEAIIAIENEVRKARPDIFYNTTVGTWASPFWFHVSDAVWRQEGDFGKIGVGDDREQWITYRDRLVYQNFVQNSPICPINTLMTHGVILTTHGAVSKTMDYDGIVREMRCAFGCGSGMVELYTDYERLNNVTDPKGKSNLWKEISDLIDWQAKNADVLPDIHWVGGNPWDGSAANIYGWASWNGQKVTFTLRNPATGSQTLTTTLRKVFDIPAFVKTSITLSSSFDDQTFGEGGIKGIDLDTPIDVDKQLTIEMPKSSVFVMEGVDNNPDILSSVINKADTPSLDTKSTKVYDLSGRRLAEAQKGQVNIIGSKKVIK